MACPRCGAEDCADLTHRIPCEVFAHILSQLPTGSHELANMNRVSSDARAVVRAIRCADLATVSFPAPALQPEYFAPTGQFGIGFIVRAQIAPTIRQGCNCRCVEYRQFVKGYFKINGAIQQHSLPNGNNLDPERYFLDGPKNCRDVYGYRVTGNKYMLRTAYYSNEPSSDEARPNHDENGCYFFLSDYPHLSSRTTGERLEINLGFRGVFLDKCTNTVLIQQEWTVAGVHTVA
jgi:hypothetical protein